MKTIKVILADDHKMFRDGIKSLISEQDDISIINEASNGLELIEEVQATPPDIVIADISMPKMSGIEATRKIKKLFPEIRVLILSMHNTSEFIFNAIDAGADGFLTKDSGQEEFVIAIKNISKGIRYFNQNISSQFFNAYNRIQKEKEKNPIKILSKREIEILKLFCEGYSNSEISKKLFISMRTVESHKTHIMQKLELKSPVEMVKIAIKYKLVEL